MMLRYARAALAVGVLSFSAAPAWPQASGGPLPRRAALGVTLAVDAAGAVVVSAVTAESAGAVAGVAPGDAIAALDGTPVTSIAQVQSLIGRHRGGRLARDRHSARRREETSRWPCSSPSHTRASRTPRSTTAT